MTVFDSLVMQTDCSTRGRAAENNLYGWIKKALTDDDAATGGTRSRTTMDGSNQGVVKDEWQDGYYFKNPNLPSGISASFPQSAYTLAARVKNVTVQGSTMAAVCFQYHATWQQGVTIGFSATNGYAYFTHWDSGGSSRSMTGTATNRVNTEAVIAVRHDGSGNAELWWNGAQEASMANHFTSGLTNMTQVGHLQQPNSGSNMYGNLAWAALWQRRLSNDEMASIALDTPNPFTRERGVLMPNRNIIQPRRF